MKRVAALAIAAIGCAADRVPIVAAAVPFDASIDAAEEDGAQDGEDAAEDGPPERAETTYDETRTREIARLRLVARNVYDAFANVMPSPVVRGYTKQTFVQFSTDKRDIGHFSWVEAATTALHGAADPAEKIEPCTAPLAPDGEVKGVNGSARLERSASHDTLVLAPRGGKPIEAKLPRGVSHGACLGPDATRVWIAWATPLSPPELHSIAIRDGTARALRVDARPGLAAIADANVTTVTLEGGAVGAMIEPKSARAGAIVVVDRSPWDWTPFARALAAAGVATLVAPVGAAAAAAVWMHARFKTAPIVAIDLVPPEVAGTRGIWLLSREPAETAPPSPVFVIGMGEATRAFVAEQAKAAAEGAWTIATGSNERDITTLAWARAIDAVLAEAR